MAGGLRRAACLGLLCLTGLLGACSSLDTWQREKLYRPTSVAGETWQQMLAQRPEMQSITLPVGQADEQVQVLRWPAQAGRTSAARVLFLHGTFRHAFQNLAKAAPMQRAGMDVYLLDYRGWGASSPRVPDEKSIHEDAWAAWQALQAREGSGGWVIYGHSMGSGVAVKLAEQLAGQSAYCGVVLESAFTSFPDVARAAAGWLGSALVLLNRERMASINRIEQVDPPLWFFHGSKDETIPIELGRQLFEGARQPKHWLQWPLGHSNLQTDPTGRYDAAWREIQSSCRRAPGR